MAEAAPATAPPPPVVPPEEPSGPQLVAADPAERGTLDVRTKAIQHIVERAVLDTPGTVAHQARWASSSAPRRPRDRHDAGPPRPRQVDVAAVWPAPVTRIATDVRDRVMHEAARLSGVFIRTVDVTVHVVTPTTSTTSRGGPVSVSTPPKARPAAALGAALFAVVLIAVAVVAVRDLAVSQGWATGRRGRSTWSAPSTASPPPRASRPSAS